jgi:hypothetical protein
MKLNRLIVSETVRALGVPGVIGVTLVVFGLSYAVSALLPAKQQIDSYREQIARAKDRAVRAETGQTDNTPSGQLRAFYKLLPPQPAVPDWLDKIYAAAVKENVALIRGEYSLATDADVGVARYKILFPVKGSYAQIRGFIAAALDAVPTLALDDVNFERQKISDAQVDARIRMTLYVKRT